MTTRYTPPNGNAPTPAKLPTSLNGYAMVAPDEDLDEETRKRRAGIAFPLHCLPEALRPLTAELANRLQGERAFIGLTMLQCASAAIGSGLRATMPNGWEVSLSMWGCCVGISSSGKSMTQGVLVRPLNQIQDEFNETYFEKLKENERSSDKPEAYPNQKVLVVNDITFESLIRDVFGHNYKGIVRYEDELLKWLDDMDRYKGAGKSEGSFWTASWAASSSYTMRRANNKFIYIDKNHLVSSVMGSTQPDVLYRFYEKDRLQTGYIFRMLWAFAEVDRVISPDLSYQMPVELTDKYNTLIKTLHEELPMNFEDSRPTMTGLRPAAVKLMQEWQDKASKAVNKMEGVSDKNVKGGILGKIKEYAFRLSAILHVMDHTLSGHSPRNLPSTPDEYMAAAIEIADYFMATGYEAYLTAKNRVIVPAQVLEFAGAWKSHQCNQSDLAKAMGITRQAVNKRLKAYMEQYPGAFGAKN